MLLYFYRSLKIRGNSERKQPARSEGVILKLNFYIWIGINYCDWADINIILTWNLKVAHQTTCTATACSFNTTYGSSSIAANLSQDSLKLATDVVPGYTFGCIQKTTGGSVPPQGLLGLGRGPLSLLSQTQSLYRSTFSYCLPSFKSLNFSGSLRLGPVQPVRMKFTQLLRNPSRSSLYYVNLVAIKVGRKIVDIPASALAFDATNGAGTIIDSGTTFHFLIQYCKIVTCG